MPNSNTSNANDSEVPIYDNFTSSDTSKDLMQKSVAWLRNLANDVQSSTKKTTIKDAWLFTPDFLRGINVNMSVWIDELEPNRKNNFSVHLNDKICREKSSDFSNDTTVSHGLETEKSELVAATHEIVIRVLILGCLVIVVTTTFEYIFHWQASILVRRLRLDIFKALQDGSLDLFKSI